LLESTIFL